MFWRTFVNSCFYEMLFRHNQSKAVWILHNLLFNLWPIYVVLQKKKIIKKFGQHCYLKTSSRRFCVCKELGTTSTGKWNFWSKLLILDMSTQSYQILSKSACRPPQIPFYRRFFENWKESGTSFQATFFTEIFDKKFSFAILYKLAKFNYQTVFTSQVNQ